MDSRLIFYKKEKGNINLDDYFPRNMCLSTSTLVYPGFYIEISSGIIINKCITLILAVLNIFGFRENLTSVWQFAD